MKIDLKDGKQPITVKFNYTNHNQEHHEYVIEMESAQWGHFTQSGVGGPDERWVIHGEVVRRDDDPRPEMGDNRRRTFLVEKIRSLEYV